MTTIKERERDEARAELRELMEGHDQIVTIFRGRSQSGMTRWLDVYALHNDDLYRLTWTISRAFGIDYDRRRDALKFSGCGYSMTTEVTYALSRLLGGDGYTIRAREL